MKYVDMQGTPIPQCMVGTWAWGNGINGSKMIFGKKYREEDLKETFQKAYELGFTFWDTAEVYGMGKAEEILGRCIQGKENILISTKHMPGKVYRRGAMARSLGGSCERLQIEKPDLYWIHIPNRLEKNVEAAVELLKTGKIRYIGLSNCSLEQMKWTDKRLSEEGFRLAAVQNHFSLLCQGQEEKKIAWCREQGIVYFSYMVLEQGALSGRYDGTHGYRGFSLRRLTFSKRKFRRIEPLLQYIRELAEKYQTDPSQIPIAWAIEKGTVPIIGLTKAKYAEQMAQTLEMGMKQEEVDLLSELGRECRVNVNGVWEPRQAKQ